MAFREQRFKQIIFEPQECPVFEDSFAGVTAAKGAEMTSVALARERNSQDVSQADLVLDCLGDFALQALL